MQPIPLAVVYNENIPEKTTQNKTIEVLSNSDEGNTRENASIQTTTGNVETEVETEVADALNTLGVSPPTAVPADSLVPEDLPTGPVKISLESGVVTLLQMNQDTPLKECTVVENVPDQTLANEGTSGAAEEAGETEIALIPEQETVMADVEVANELQSADISQGNLERQ